MFWYNYPLAMKRSLIKDIELKVLLKEALTEKIDDCEVYIRGLDASYHYEGYHEFKSKNLLYDFNKEI